LAAEFQNKGKKIGDSLQNVTEYCSLSFIHLIHIISFAEGILGHVKVIYTFIGISTVNVYFETLDNICRFHTFQQLFFSHKFDDIVHFYRRTRFLKHSTILSIFTDEYVFRYIRQYFSYFRTNSKHCLSNNFTQHNHQYVFKADIRHIFMCSLSEICTHLQIVVLLLLERSICKCLTFRDTGYHSIVPALI
jgi:hypothetical protein